MDIVVATEHVGGCEWIRGAVPYLEMRRRGHNVVWCEKISKGDFGVERGTFMTKDARGVAWGVIRADVLVFQRVIPRHLLEAAHAAQARYGAKIVYELDDNFLAMPSANPGAKDFHPGSESAQVLREFLALADLLTVSTNGLREAYERYRGGKPIAVCPNALDDRHFTRFARAYDGAPKRPGQIRIGYAGSNTHVGDFGLALPALCAIMDEFPQVRVVLLGADMRAMFSERFFSRWRAENRVEYAGCTVVKDGFRLEDLTDPTIAPVAYYDLLDAADFDIAIAPIEPNVFNRGKSWIKLLEMAQAYIPTVASNFGPYRDFARGADAPVTLLADEKRDWVRHLRDLVTSAERRAVLANAARLHVGKQHLISTGVDAWEAALRALVPEIVAA